MRKCNCPTGKKYNKILLQIRCKTIVFFILCQINLHFFLIKSIFFQINMVFFFYETPFISFGFFQKKFFLFPKGLIDMIYRINF